MKRNAVLGYSVALLFLTAPPFYAQEDQEIQVEQSSEVFLEEYTDEFQEKFFEALKQKGIQNHDRAIHLLLECSEMDPDNSTIAHELAKAYLAEKQYANAKTHGMEALGSAPENYWYLNTLTTILEAQGERVEDIKNTIPYANPTLRRNLALIYFRQEAYSKALSILNGLESSFFKKDLARKINDSLSLAAAAQKLEIATREDQDDSTTDTVLSNYKKDIEQLFLKEDFSGTVTQAGEAREAYPLQPFFYYFQGAALLELGEVNRAITVLEEGLEYLFDDELLANKFYKTLSEAFTKVGNVSKANMYANKIKTGS